MLEPKPNALNIYRLELDVSHNSSYEEIDHSYRIHYLHLRHNLNIENVKC